MFGHGLSKGSDMDENGYLGMNYSFIIQNRRWKCIFTDLAVGAPNAETVYIYKAYPVVKVVATIIAETNELQTSDSSLTIKACWYLKSNTELKNNNISMFAFNIMF